MASCQIPSQFLLHAQATIWQGGRSLYLYSVFVWVFAGHETSSESFVGFHATDKVERLYSAVSRIVFGAIQNYNAVGLDLHKE